jgi:hypothetical protein
MDKAKKQGCKVDEGIFRAKFEILDQKIRNRSK